MYIVIEQVLNVAYITFSKTMFTKIAILPSFRALWKIDLCPKITFLNIVETNNNIMNQILGCTKSTLSS